MTLQEAIQVIDEIKSDYDADVIKDYEIPPLMNINTGKETGFGVKLRLNTKYDYDDDTLNSWKKKLKADSWYIHVRSNQLFVMYKIHYRIPNEELERKALVEQIQKEGSQLAARIAKMELCFPRRVVFIPKEEKAMLAALNFSSSKTR